MRNIIKEKVFVWPCTQVAAATGAEQCDHGGFNLTPLLNGSFEYVICPVGVVLTYRAYNALTKHAFIDEGESRYVVEFQPVVGTLGQPYICAWTIQKDGSPPHPCGKPTVYFHDKADDRIPVWSYDFDRLQDCDQLHVPFPEYDGVCRIHTQTLSGAKVTNLPAWARSAGPRDFQRSKVYRWEGEVFSAMGTPSMTLDECRELVERIWAALAPDEVPPPVVTLKKSVRRSDGNHLKIRLSPNHLNPIMTVHETTHGLLSAVGEDIGHGPLFVRLYLELLERYAGETPEPAENLKVASYQELTAVEGLRGFEIAAKAA